MTKPTLNLSHPAILEELWQSSAFDSAVYQLLEAYTSAQESGELEKDTPRMRQLAQDIYYHLTTTRNRNLITDKEQKVLRQSVGGFFGLSTGSHAVTTWIMQSRANTVKIIDPDLISPSNLNRMRFGWETVGQDKIDAVAAEITNISPYTTIIKTKETDETTTQKLFSESPKLDFVIEAIDDLKAKVALRLLAKKHRIPLIMATDVGDNIYLDIERYDITPQPQLFNGRVNNSEQINFDSLSANERMHLAIQIVGLDRASVPMLQSLHSIGKDISTWPQLGATASIAGGICTSAIKKILLGEPVNSGRYYISLDEHLNRDFTTEPYKQTQANWIEKIHSKYGIK